MHRFSWSTTFPVLVALLIGVMLGMSLSGPSSSSGESQQLRSSLPTVTTTASFNPAGTTIGPESSAVRDVSVPPSTASDPFYSDHDAAAVCVALVSMLPLRPSFEGVLDTTMKARHWRPDGSAPRFAPSRTQLFKDLYHSDVNPYKGWQAPDTPVPDYYSNAEKRSAAIQGRVLKALGRAPDVVVEVGSFVGSGAVSVWAPLAKHGGNDGVVICIDTWAGDLNMRLGEQFQQWMRLDHGFPQLSQLFMKNVVAKGLTDTVFPMPLTSFLGARLLFLLGYKVDVIYVDSAHEVGETLSEIWLYWQLLKPGGVLLGDDLNWRGVRKDVEVFGRCVGVQPVVFSEIQWMIQKPIFA